MVAMRGMICARMAAVLVLVVSYGALSARQPAVRTSMPLPSSADQLASSLGLDPTDRSQLLISIVRLIFDAPDGYSAEDQKRRAVLSAQLKGPAVEPSVSVPLPLDASIWRETLLAHPVKDNEIAAAILSDRSTALLYHGLAALDDDTLGWLGPDRETLLHLRRNAATFATFGRSIRIRGGRVSVPGGRDAEPIWAAIVGADPGRPTVFVQRLFRGNGRLAWFYDSIQHLDREHQRLVYGDEGSDPLRIERTRELLDVFEAAAPEWQIPARPFVRPALDPSVVVSLAAVNSKGDFIGPGNRRVWELVFRDQGSDAVPVDSPGEQASADNRSLEPSWLTRRISLVPAHLGRQRLETFLFAQRVFSNQHAEEEATMVSALRGAIAFPSLALTLERIGVTEASAYASAARTAIALNAIRSAEWRRVAIAEFQGSLAIVDRAVRMGGLNRKAAVPLTSSLLALPISATQGYGEAFVQWLRQQLIAALPLQADAADPIEESILVACAGVKDGAAAATAVEWEGRRYRVDPASAELRRLRRIRERQRAVIRGVPRSSTTLDARLAALATAAPDSARLPLEQAVAETLTGIVYAAHSGEPEGPAASAGDVASRHNFGLTGNVTGQAWRLPREEHGHRGGWRVAGSLLGLDVALGRLALRRLDLSDMPGEPRMSTNERTSAMLTAAMFGPLSDADGVRDEIAAALARGRARVDSLGGDRADIDRVAQDAGLSEWRRQAVEWTIEHDREKLLSRFSLVELFWLGSPRGAPSRAFDAWGAATVMLDGCLCLRMPDATPWETRAGRASTGYLATRGVDVTLRVANFLAEAQLPASLAPAVVGYAMQDVIDTAQPAFFDDWTAFQRAARDLPRDRLVDYVAAVAADGTFVPLTTSEPRQ